MILLAYDGSADAQTAIDQAGALFSGEPATILTVWEPFLDVMARTGAGLGLASGIVDYEEIDKAYERSARDRAGDGIERAQRAGLNAQPRTRTRHTTIAEAILSEADVVGARAIVLGTRGLTGIRSLLLGSVSHAVLQHADRHDRRTLGPGGEGAGGTPALRLASGEASRACPYAGRVVEQPPVRPRAGRPRRPHPDLNTVVRAAVEFAHRLPGARDSYRHFKSRRSRASFSADWRAAIGGECATEGGQDRTDCAALPQQRGTGISSLT